MDASGEGRPPHLGRQSVRSLRVWQSRILRPHAVHTCIPSPRTFFNPYTLYLRPWAVVVIVQCSVQFSSVQFSRVRLFTTLWTVAHQASLSFTIAQSLFQLMSIESVMPSNYLIFCCPLLLLPSIFSSIRIFSNESALHIRWPKYWSFSHSLSNNN